MKTLKLILKIMLGVVIAAVIGYFFLRGVKYENKRTYKTNRLPPLHSGSNHARLYSVLSVVPSRAR